MNARWPIHQLGDVCDVIGGGTPPKDQAHYFQGTIPWATVRDMRQDVIAETEFSITEDAVKASATNIIPANNVIIATRVGLGKVCLIERDTAINQDLRGIIPKNEKQLLVRFLFWWCRSVASQIAAAGTGATVQGVKLTFIKALGVPVPPLSEQKRIVAILDEAFVGIAAAAANTKMNLANARRLFEGYLDRIINQPKGLSTATVEDLVKDGILAKPLDGNHGEIHPKKADFVDSGVPFIMASDLVDGLVDQSNCNFLSRKQADSLRTGYARSGDVLLSHKGTIGRVAVLYTDLDYVMLTPQVTFYRILDTKTLSNRYLYYFFQSKIFQEELRSYADEGSTRSYIGITKQMKLNVSFPPLEIQNSYVRVFDVLKSYCAEIESIYQKKLSALAELKKAILESAFAGELTAHRPEDLLDQDAA